MTGGKTERDVQAALMTWVMDDKHHAFAIPNSQSVLSWTWEADLLSVTRAGLFHEYEIKLNKSDYKRDFSKRYKHKCLKSRSGWRIPCYFWYVTCGFDIDPPDYTGWARCRAGEIIVEKPAPRLDGRRLRDGDYQTAARLLSYRLKNTYRREVK